MSAIEDLSPRRVDLSEYLNGNYKPPSPSVGAERDDGLNMLYPGRWHSCIALTTAGKTWWALWHAVALMRDGKKVVYAHFEESSPSGTLARLRLMAPDLTDKQILARFVWLDCSLRWEPDEFGGLLPRGTGLVVLDGINAACAKHGWGVDKPDAVGHYRNMFVTPAVNQGIAVLSLGHPVKDRTRQTERHGFGSSAWLDEVDGVGFRMEAGKKTPIRKGSKGYSALYTVKDRYGEVERYGRSSESRESGWYYMGAFTIDNRHNRVDAHLTEPKDEDVIADGVDALAASIVTFLETVEGQRFSSARALIEMMRDAEISFNDKNIGPALKVLQKRGELEWPEVSGRKSRPGWLVATALDEI